MNEHVYGNPASGSIAFVGVGSNRSDRLGNIHAAAVALSLTPGITGLTSSPVYETRPIGNAGPELFLNAVFRLTLRLSPLDLLQRQMEIETALGRGERRQGPRPIDLDLLFYDDLVFQSGTLIVPHPRVHCRAFVLRPLADLAPEYCHPEMELSIRELLERLPVPNEIVRRLRETIVIDEVPVA